MKTRYFRLGHAWAALVVGLLLAAPVAAHPKLLAATPAANAVSAPTTRIDLSFSEPMMPAMTSVDLAHMAGAMAHPIAGKLRFAADNRSVTLLLAAPLPAGAYAVEWKSVGADTHKVAGRYLFTVR